LGKLYTFLLSALGFGGTKNEFFGRENFYCTKQKKSSKEDDWSDFEHQTRCSSEDMVTVIFGGTEKNWWHCF
jgi:hypothetical protein